MSSNPTESNTSSNINANLPLANDSGDRGQSGKMLVLMAAFLGWMFDGLEMGLFPQIASKALPALLKGQFAEKSPEFAAAKLHWQVVITACFLFGAALGGLVFGWLGDKIGRVKAMSASILVYSGFTGLLYFVNSPAQMAAMRFTAAIGMGGEWALGVALVNEVWDAKYRPMLAGLIGAASNVGFVLIATICFFVPVTESSWRKVVLIGAAPALITFLIQIFVPESHKWEESQKKAKSKPLTELFGDSKLTALAIMAICFASVALLGTWGAIQNIPSWVELDLKTKVANAKPICGIISGVGAIIGCLIAPIIAAKLNRRSAYFLLCLGSLAACLFLFKHFNSFDDNNYYRFLGMVLVSGGITAAFYGWLPLYLPELFPTRVRATAQGIAFNSGRIVAGIGSIILAQYSVNFGTLGSYVAMIYIVGMIIIWFAPETKGKPLPE